MEDRLTIQLPRDLTRAVKSAARRIKRRPSEVVKMVLRAFLEVGPAPAGRPADRVRLLLGSLESGIPDLAEKQRAYVLESLKNARLKTATCWTNVALPSRLISAIDAAVGRRGRSRFILRAAERELKRLAQVKALRSAAGSWADRDHPELRKGSAAWVNRIRSEGERRLKRVTRKRRSVRTT
jgi:metal-responsive CopG/Arc/MetJ family transcriptional regulator